MPLMNFSNYWKVNWFIGKAEVCLGHELRKINKNGQTWTAMRNENSKGGRRLDKKDSRAEKALARRTYSVVGLSMPRVVIL